MSWDGPEDGSTPESSAAEEQRRAVRLLLAHPFVTDTQPDSGSFALVRRHGRELQRWFAEQLGYRLVVETDLARLHKRPAPGAHPRPLETQSGQPFTPRRYALLCLVLAALERMEVQTILSELAEQVALLAASEEAVRRFDLESYAERQAFVDAVRWLVELGVLTLADGTDTGFIEGHGDALYDLHTRRLAQLLSASVPSSPLEELETIGVEVYPGTEEGANRRARHRLMRRLLEEPTLYLDDLDDAERSYLGSQRHYLVRQAAELAGLEVEVRREGLAAIDPQGRLTDLAFPSSGTVSHAALLLAEDLARQARASRETPLTVPNGELRARLDDLAARFGRQWSKRYQEEPSGLDQLLRDALERLAQMGLLARDAEGVRPLPAIARYAVLAPEPRRRDEASDD